MYLLVLDSFHDAADTILQLRRRCAADRDRAFASLGTNNNRSTLVVSVTATVQVVIGILSNR